MPLPEPVRPAVLESVSVPPPTVSVSDHVGSSGPASRSYITMPSPEVEEKITGSPGSWRTACVGAWILVLRWAETSEVFPCGSVAVAVMTGSPAGAEKGTSKIGLALAVRRHLQRTEVLIGLAGAAGAKRGAGEDVDAEGRIGQAPTQPALELAACGGDDNGEVLEVVGTETLDSRVFSNSVITKVDGLTRVAEDAITRDRV